MRGFFMLGQKFSGIVESIAVKVNFLCKITSKSQQYLAVERKANGKRTIWYLCRT